MGPQWETAEYYMRHRDAVVLDLAKALKARTLGLMIGAGASKDLNLPSWDELVKKCCRTCPTPVEANDIDSTSSGDELMLRMARVRSSFAGDDAAYLASVSKALYEQWKNPRVQDAPELMRAIGVLVTGSVRGRISCILNFNFDSLLEWYLSLHGYVVQVIEDVPRGLLDTDVHIFHPHGYLPLNPSFGRPSPMILLDQQAIEDRALDHDNAWMDVFRYLLGTQVFLAVGLSGKDPMSNLVIAAAEKQRRKHDLRPMGFWFYKEGAIGKDYEQNLLDKRVVLAPCDTHASIAETLFQIAQKAAGAVVT